MISNSGGEFFRKPMASAFLQKVEKHATHSWFKSAISFIGHQKLQMISRKNCARRLVSDPAFASYLKSGLALSDPNAQNEPKGMDA